MQDKSLDKVLLIDTTFLFDQYSFRGIGKYGKEVVKRLIKLALDEGVNVSFVGFYDLKKNLITLGLSQFAVEMYSKQINFWSLGEPVYSSLGNFKRWSKTYAPILEQVKPTVFFSANFERGLPSTLFLKKIHNIKTVVMAHDAIPLVTNKYTSKSPIHNLIKGLFYNVMFTGIKNADLVLTNSNYSKSDLVKKGKVKESKVKAIYLGVDENFFNKTQDRVVKHVVNSYGITPQGYFVYDSGLETNKGINELIKIFKGIIENKVENIPTKLVIVGKDFTKAQGNKIQPKNSRAEQVLRIFKKEGILNNLITTDKVSDEDLSVLIKQAYCYLNFSRYEGFGFGPLQAMASKVRVIAGNYSCTPEVTDGGAFLVETSNIKDTTSKIINYLKDEEQVRLMLEKGYQVSTRYSWDTTTEQTWKEIKNLL